MSIFVPPKFIFPLFLKLGLIFLLEVHYLQAFSQSGGYRFDHLGIEQGLSQSSVICIMQDSRGFMWFGTEDGLNRYDGYTFKVYRHNPNDSTSISSNNITAIKEDHYGNLWIGTGGKGINKFDPQSDTFKRFEYIPKITKKSDEISVAFIFIDRLNRVWFRLKGHLGVFYFDTQTKIIHHIVHLDPEFQLSVWSMAEDSSGNIWAGMTGGICRYDSDKKKFTNIVSANPIMHEILSYSYNRYGYNRVMSLRVDRDNNLWLGGNGWVSKYKPALDEISIYPIVDKDFKKRPDTNTHELIFDLEGNKWFATSQGLKIFNPNKGVVEPFVNQPLNNLEHPSIKSIFLDNSETIWLGTYDGLFKQNFRYRSFRFYKAEKNELSLSHKRVRSFAESSDGTVWIGTEGGGLNKLKMEESIFRSFKNFPGTKGAIPHIWGLADSKEFLWIITDQFGLFSMRKDNLKIIRVLKELPISGFSILSLNEETLLIGSYNEGIFKINPSTESFDQLKIETNESPKYGANKIRAIAIDSSKNVWIGTSGNGLYKINRDSLSISNIKEFQNELGNKSSLSHNQITSIYTDSKGILWVGTYGGGINLINPITEKISHIREADGLPNDNVYGILEDEKGFYWISTNMGISKFNLESKTFFVYDISDGLQSNEFNSGAFLKRKNGELLFGGVNGFNVFHPDSLEINPHKPLIAFTDFELFNQPWDSLSDYPLPKSINETSEVRLRYAQNGFSIEFAVLDFVNPRKNLYKYRLNGFDDNWKTTNSSRRFITYTKLKPGKYVFQVKGANSDGIWNESAKEVKILVEPPWYWWNLWAYTLWFTLFVFFVVFIIWGIIHNLRSLDKIKIEKEEKERLKKLNKSQSQIYSNISHEFRTPLTMIITPIQKRLSEDLPLEIEDFLKKINHNALRLLRLINQILDLSKLDAGFLQLNEEIHDLTAHIKFVIENFRPLAEEKDIEINSELPDDRMYCYYDFEKVENIITNIFSNSIKFTPEGGRVSIIYDYQISTTNQSLGKFELKISDTGPGIPENEHKNIFNRYYQISEIEPTGMEPSTGIGLSHTKELVDLLGGAIEIESQLTKGTTFKISLPLKLVKPLERENSAFQNKNKQNLLEDNNGNEDDLNLTSIVSSKPNILIIEDQKEMRILLKDILSPEYSILEAENGTNGLEIAFNKVPDLIISDVMMPGINGTILCEKLKSDEITNHIPIILLTAKADFQSKMVGMEKGADAYIAKPFNNQELTIQISNLLDHRKKIQKYLTNQITKDPKLIRGNIEEQKFLNRLIGILENNYTNPDFNVELLGQKMRYDRRQILRKIKGITNQNTSEFIRNFRLRKAAILLTETSLTTSEISYKVGFNNPSYFSTCFNNLFKCTPSEYRS